MKPFDEHAACPKCGWATVQTSYHAGEKYGPGPSEEHLRRACQRCHYSWNEAPIQRDLPEPLKSGD